MPSGDFREEPSGLTASWYLPEPHCNPGFIPEKETGNTLVGNKQATPKNLKFSAEANYILILTPAFSDSGTVITLSNIGSILNFRGMLIVSVTGI